MLSNFLALQPLLTRLRQVLNNIPVWRLLALVAIFIRFGAYGQDTIQLPEKDTIYLDESDFESPVIYSARDSIFADLRAKKLYLFGDASLFYTDVNMKAEYIMVDLDKNEVLATYQTDSLGNRIGLPVFAQGSDTMTAASIRYNFNTKKGFIKEVAIKQDEIYLTMETAKRQANEEIHFIDGKITTCNLTEPHYHFALSKAVMVPDKRIVTGPMNLWIMGVPTPLGLPFSIIPQTKDKEAKAGFIMPQIVPSSAYGFGFQNLGYYIPISPKFQTTMYGMLYSRGSFGFNNASDYNFRYKSQGKFTLGYQFFRQGFPIPASQNRTAYTVTWTHTQDPKANPKWKFNSNVNFNSQSSNKATLNTQTSQYFDNSLNSDIRLDRFFPGKPIQMGIKSSLRQSSTAPTANFVAPVFNITATRFYPFKRKKATIGKTRFYETIGATYSMETKNIADFKSRYIKNGNFDSIGQQFRNGITQSATLTTTINMLKNIIRFTPTVSYTQRYNFQSIDKHVDTNNRLIVDTVAKPYFSQSLTFSAGFTTNFYSYYRFIGKKRTLLRHVMTPSVTMNATPSIQGSSDATYADTNGIVYHYSRLERSVYAQNYIQSAGRIDFSLGNSFELKQLSKKDTVTGFRKTRIIDNLTFGASYNMFADSMRWTPISIRMVVSPWPVINMVFAGSLSPYAYNRETGISNAQYAVNHGEGLGRLSSYSVTTSYTLAPKGQRAQTSDATKMANVWNPEFQQWMIMPQQIINFDIPWKVSFNHFLGYNINTDPTTYQSKRYTTTHTLNLQADLSITPNWKIAAITYFDLSSGTVANTRIDLYRNLHCWNMSFNWTPIGTNKAFLISIRGNGRSLSNVFLNLRRPQSLFSN